MVNKKSYIAFVLHKDGTPLMPIKNPARVRRLLKTKNAAIAKYDPFTIQLTRDSGKAVQPIEMCIDAGEVHIGISIKTEKTELVSEQRDLLPNEKERHDDRRKARRSRRNRKRHRKPKWGCRKHGKRKNKNLKGKEKQQKTASEKWFPPTLQNKKEQHIKLVERYKNVLPLSYVYIEVGQFDTRVLKAIESGSPVPQGLDYQHGPRYGHDTLREAVFARDNYTCLCCGSTIGKICTGKDENGKPKYKSGEVILRMHHLGFKTGDRSNRMGNLASVCTRCHTPANHKPGGKLYDLEPKLKSFSGAAFLNAVKFAIFEGVSNLGLETHLTYGAVTKRTRLDLNIVKSHANDAYCIGRYHPKHRAHTTYWQKVRRNNRCLEKFYDAKYTDSRTGEEVKANALGCERTNRKIPRNNPRNKRSLRGKKISNGYRSIRRTRYDIQPGDIVLFDGKRHLAKGVHSNGEAVQLENHVSVPIENVDFRNNKGELVPINKVKTVKIIGRKGKPVKCRVVSYSDTHVVVSYPLEAKPSNVKVLRHVGGWKQIH